MPDDLVEGEAEVRRLVDAGAGSPEEIRALAERLRAQRAREEEAWRREVRPALIMSKKARPFAGRRPREERDGRSTIGPALAALAAIVVLVLVAAQTSVLVLLLPVLGVLVYAYRQGREP